MAASAGWGEACTHCAAGRPDEGYERFSLFCETFIRDSIRDFLKTARINHIGHVCRDRAKQNSLRATRHKRNKRDFEFSAPCGQLHVKSGQRLGLTSRDKTPVGGGKHCGGRKDIAGKWKDIAGKCGWLLGRLVPVFSVRARQGAGGSCSPSP
jgi:hypothetical protein